MPHEVRRRSETYELVFFKKTLLCCLKGLMSVIFHIDIDAAGVF